MENKIVMVLKDKKLLEDLVSNEETKIKIQDAVVGSVVKKILNLSFSSNKEFRLSIHKMIREEFFINPENYLSMCIFKEDYKKAIKRALDEILASLLKEINIEEYVKEALGKATFKEAVRREVHSILSETFTQLKEEL
jgi:hypothetical protein